MRCVYTSNWFWATHKRTTKTAQCACVHLYIAHILARSIVWLPNTTNCKNLIYYNKFMRKHLNCSFNLQIRMDEIHAAHSHTHWFNLTWKSCVVFFSISNNRNRFWLYMMRWCLAQFPLRRTQLAASELIVWNCSSCNYTKFEQSSCVCVILSFFLFVTLSNRLWACGCSSCICDARFLIVVQSIKIWLSYFLNFFCLFSIFYFFGAVFVAFGTVIIHSLLTRWQRNIGCAYVYIWRSCAKYVRANFSLHFSLFFFFFFFCVFVIVIGFFLCCCYTFIYNIHFAFFFIWLYNYVRVYIIVYMRFSPWAR